MLFCLVLSSGILDGVGLCILLEIGLSITINSEVGKQSLIASSLGLANVGHLDRLLSQLPLVPVVVRIDVLLNEMGWSLDSLIHHQLILDSSLYCLVHKAQLDLASK